MTITKSLAAASLVLGLVSTTLAVAADGVSPAVPAAVPAPSRPADAITLSVPRAGFGQSPVLAWSWGASNTGRVTGGGSAGKANFQDLSFTRATDSQSPKFLEAVAAGTHIPTVSLQDGPILITLTDVLVSSYSTGDTSDRKTTPTENISLNFARFTYQFNGVIFTWDIAANGGQ